MFQIWAELEFYFNAVIVQNLEQSFAAFKAVLIRVTTADIDSGSAALSLLKSSVHSSSSGSHGETRIKPFGAIAPLTAA